MIKKILRWGAIVALVLFAAIQLKQIDRANPPVATDVGAPSEVQEILRRACYACHSHETQWPWYSYIAPVSWWMADHVEHGRGDLNFSEWPQFDFEEQEHAFKDIREQITKDEMPLKSFRIMHPEARLTDAEKEVLLRWAGD